MATLPALTSVGLLATLGFGVQGLRGQSQSWPWACYPTFQWIVPGEQHDVLAIVVGAEPPVSYPTPEQARRRSQREWGRMYRLLGAYGEKAHTLADARCTYARRLVAEGKLPAVVGGSARIDLQEVARSTAPERWNDEPTAVRHLARCSAP